MTSETPHPLPSEEMTATELTEQRRRRWPWLVVGAVAIIMIASLIFFYRWPAQASWLSGVAKAVHLPVALVNGSIITYNELDFERQVLEHISQQDPAAPTLSDDQLTTAAFDQLVNEQLLSELAKRYGLVVAPAELDVAWQTGPARLAGGEQAAVDEVQNYFGWTVDEYKERVLRSRLLIDRLQGIIAVDADLQAAQRQKAERVMGLVQEGKQSFEELAQEYSDDTSTKIVGGDLGTFGRGVMVPTFEAAAFALEIGQVSGIVETDFGYHIIKVLEHTPASGDQPEQVHAQHILISYLSLEEYIQQLRDSARIIALLSPLENKTPAAGE